MDWLFHLWAHAPLGAVVPCPPPLPGEPIDPGGLYDPAQLAGLWDSIAAVSAIAVVLLVLGTYLLPRASLSPRFVRNWWLALAASGLVCALVPLALGLTAQVNVRAGSCSTRPAPFPADVPFNLLVERMIAGAVWGVLAFAVLSLVATQVFGRSRLAGGFFHHRGCPWPRWNPTQG